MMCPPTEWRLIRDSHHSAVENLNSRLFNLREPPKTCNDLDELQRRLEDARESINNALKLLEPYVP